jgi:hypothetical protein
MATNLHIYYEKSMKRWPDRIVKILANVSEGKSKAHFTHIVPIRQVSVHIFFPENKFRYLVSFK